MAPPAPLHVFLHIRKTGGTSLRWILESRFAARRVLRCYRVKGCTPESIPHYFGRFPSRFRLFVTMDGYDIADLVPAESRCLTMLRNPERRCLSNHRHRYIGNPGR